MHPPDEPPIPANVRFGSGADLNGNPEKRPLSEVVRTEINGPQYVVRPLIAKKETFRCRWRAVGYIKIGHKELPVGTAEIRSRCDQVY